MCAVSVHVCPSACFRWHVIYQYVGARAVTQSAYINMCIGVHGSMHMHASNQFLIPIHAIDLLLTYSVIRVQNVCISGVKCHVLYQM